MVKRLVSALAIAGLLLPVSIIMSCTDESTPSAPSITQAQMIGLWIPVAEAYAWDVTEGGVRDQGSETYTVVDTEEIAIVTNSTIVFYYDWGGTCYDSEGAPYTLSGNSVLDADTGDFFAGTETDAGISYTWSTTVAMSGNQLVLTWQVGFGGDMIGWERSSYTYAPYTGQFPPVGWPLTPCPAPKKLGKKRAR